MDLAVAGTSIWPLREPRKYLADSCSTGDIRLSPHPEQGEGVLLETRGLRIIGPLLHESMPGDCELLYHSVYFHLERSKYSKEITLLYCFAGKERTIGKAGTRTKGQS